MSDKLKGSKAARRVGITSYQNELSLLRQEVAALERDIESVELWQRNWFRRAFHRWCRPSRQKPRVGFWRRLERSLRKRRKLLLGAGQAAAPLGSTGKSKKVDYAAAYRLSIDSELNLFLSGDGRISFPFWEAPAVSVVILLYNQAAFTLACLRALEQSLEVPFEVILVDNQSTDRTPELLARVKGATVLVNTENVGFIRGVNQGAAHSRGTHLLMLNNDAVLSPGSLAAALKAFDLAPDIGAVGGRLIHPNGLLQEAGSIVWNDGSCAGYARGLPAEASEAMFRRDVDFCSGAFLMVRREDFLRLGGLDEVFAPAYYEETDLCMRLREAGLRVIYEPRVEVRHFEFASSDRREAAIAQQVKNQVLFRERHASRLTGHFAPADRNMLFARSRQPGNKRVLVIDDRVPLPTYGSGCPRSQELVMVLCRAGYTVTFWPVSAIQEDWDRVYEVLPAEVEVILGRGKKHMQAFLEERQGYYRTLIASRPHNMKSLSALFHSEPHLLGGMRIIYDAEAVFASREISKAQMLGTPLSRAEAERLVDSEVELARASDAIIVTSQEEARHFNTRGFKNVHVVSHSPSVLPSRCGFQERLDFLFVGRLSEDDSPNTDSILWFVNEVLPRIQLALGLDVKILIAGMNSAPCLANLNNKGIRLLGAVDDLAELYGSSRVFIAPTRFGAGIPLKVLEASAYGLPVVATELLVRQLQWVSGEDILAASDPDSFARSCIRLYSEQSLWERVRENALLRIRTECSPECFRDEILNLIEA